MEEAFKIIAGWIARSREFALCAGAIRTALGLFLAHDRDDAIGINRPAARSGQERPP